MHSVDATSYFEGKKVTLMGLGLLGRGVGDAKYLAECGAELIVTDLKTKEQLASSLEVLKSFPNISYTLGEHELADFTGRDLIIKAAGVPLDSPYIAEAKKHGIPVRMSADLFMELSGVKTIGITGTRGKSTTTHMIAAILKAAGKKVLLGGNVRGVSNLQLLNEATPESVAVLELDSWQCQGLGEAKLSPHIAVFTNFMIDHMNYYKNDLQQYFRDKANIFLYQKPGDVCVAGYQCYDGIKHEYEGKIASKILLAQPVHREPISLKIPGAHNQANAACAAVAAHAFGIDLDTILAALAEFRGVPGRLELVREVNGVKIYNDTTATTPEATLAAFEALDENIIWIGGGADKNLDMNTLLLAVPKHVKRTILLSGTGTERIKDHLGEVMIYHNLADAVSAAIGSAEPGDTILFSPAFASFGMFKNEYDRGDQFNALISALPAGKQI